MTSQLDDLFAPAELDADLAPFIEGDGPMGPMLRHPLAYAMFYTPEQNRMLNRGYHAKRAALHTALDERDWSSYVFLHERPYRLEAFLELGEHLADDPAAYWSLFGRVWIDSENIRQNYEVWTRLLRLGDRVEMRAMMDDDERARLDVMPSEFTIFQGHTDERDDGWSWTLDLGTASWFARRFARLEDASPLVTEGKVKRDDVIALLTSRNEEEVLVDRDLVSIVEVVRCDQ